MSEPLRAKRTREPVCARADLHAPMPSGYVAFMEHAEELAKTHRQEKCPCCGRWALWLPRASLADSVLKSRSARDGNVTWRVEWVQTSATMLPPPLPRERTVAAHNEFSDEQQARVRFDQLARLGAAHGIAELRLKKTSWAYRGSEYVDLAAGDRPPAEREES